MTEEEIRPIAENYVEEFCYDIHGEYDESSLICAGIGTALIIARKLEKQNKELQEENLELKSKIKHLTEHLEPQTMTALFKQVEEEWGKEQRIKELEEQVEKMKKCAICIDRNISCIDCVNKNKFRLDLHIEDSETEENGKAKKIISELCRSIRFLNSNDNTKLTNVDVFLKEAEDFIN